MIAYYAHNQGSGHFNSARLFCENIYTKTVILTSKQSEEHILKPVVQICSGNALKKECKSSLSNSPEYVHFFPKSSRKDTYRTKQIIDIILTYDIRLACVDVSVETAIIFRMSAVPYAYCLLPGTREDRAHLMAFNAAEFLFSFLPKAMFLNLPEELEKKTFFLGFQSRFAFRDNNCTIEETPTLENKKVLILCGNVETNITVNLINLIVGALPECDIKIIGNFKQSLDLESDRYLGFKEDIEEIINESEVVISSCGISLTSEILAIKNKFISISEERPYNQQEVFQDALVENNLSIRFDRNRIRESITDYLQLKPPKDLKKWFNDSEEIKKLKSKILEYES